MKLHITNPTLPADYGVWEFKELIKGLSDPSAFSGSKMAIAASMVYDLSGDELEFEIVEAPDLEKQNKELLEALKEVDEYFDYMGGNNHVASREARRKVKKAIKSTKG